MAMNRTWVTREEIAEIYDVLAKKEVDKVVLSLDSRGGWADKTRFAKALLRQKQAAGFRDIDRFSKPIGTRS